MKKLVFVALAFLFLQGVYALSTDMKETYRPGETVISKIQGVVLSEINPSQMILKRNNLEVAFDYDIKRINGDYYFWFIVPQNLANYRMIVEDVTTTSAGQTVTLDLVENFSVAGGLIDYSVKPGFIVTASNFELTSVLYEDIDKEISVDFPSVRNLLLEPGVNEFDFSVMGVVGTQFVTINFGQYALPAYIIGNASGTNQSQNSTNSTANNQTIIGQNSTNVTSQNSTNNTIEEFFVPEFKFTKRIIRSRVLLNGEIPLYQIEIANLGEHDIRGMFLDYDKSLFDIQPERNIFISAGENITLNLRVIREERENYRDAVIANVGNVSDYMRFILEFTSNESDVGTNSFDGDNSEDFYCAELGGKVCYSDETCDGESKASADGSCCLVECKKEEPTSYSWVGYLIAAILIVVVAIVYLKYKKTKGGGGGAFGNKFHP